MAEFDISRGAGRATLDPALRAIVYLEMLAGFHHECGAWLVIAACPAFPSVLSIHWRATSHYSEDCLEFVGAFEEPDEEKAWLRALKCAEIAWQNGPSKVLETTARESQDRYNARLLEGRTKGGRNSGKVRKENSEARQEAEDLAKRFGLHMVPRYDPQVWIFNPTRDAMSRPVINFTWNKQKQTYAYIAVESDNDGFEIGRGWFPGMNDDNARIEEVIAHHVGASYHKDDTAVLMLERLLKTNPEHWLKGDYVRFA